MSQQFDNMIQVLAYFADQCDLFKPMLDGVNKLQSDNEGLTKALATSSVLQNRMQLNSTYSADYANFGVETVRLAAASEGEISRVGNINPMNSEIDDLYLLIKLVINVGKHNYDRAKMEELLDFYSMTDKLDFDHYLELFDLIEEQHLHEPETLPDDVLVEEEHPTTTLPDDALVEEKHPAVTLPEESEESAPAKASFFKKLKL